jgi:hypothetical protein
MFLWPKNNENGVMAHAMAEWSNGRIDGNGQMAGMAEWRNG